MKIIYVICVMTTLISHSQFLLFVFYFYFSVWWIQTKWFGSWKVSNISFSWILIFFLVLFVLVNKNFQRIIFHHFLHSLFCSYFPLFSIFTLHFCPLFSFYYSGEEVLDLYTETKAITIKLPINHWESNT